MQIIVMVAEFMWTRLRHGIQQQYSCTKAVPVRLASETSHICLPPSCLNPLGCRMENVAKRMTYSLCPSVRRLGVSRKGSGSHLLGKRHQALGSIFSKQVRSIPVLRLIVQSFHDRIHAEISALDDDRSPGSVTNVV